MEVEVGDAHPCPVAVVVEQRRAPKRVHRKWEADDQMLVGLPADARTSAKQPVVQMSAAPVHGRVPAGQVGASNQQVAPLLRLALALALGPRAVLVRLDPALRSVPTLACRTSVLDQAVAARVSQDQGRTRAVRLYRIVPQHRSDQTGPTRVIAQVPIAPTLPTGRAQIDREPTALERVHAPVRDLRRAALVTF